MTVCFKLLISLYPAALSPLSNFWPIFFFLFSSSITKSVVCKTNFINPFCQKNPCAHFSYRPLLSSFWPRLRLLSMFSEQKALQRGRQILQGMELETSRTGRRKFRICARNLRTMQFKRARIMLKD